MRKHYLNLTNGIAAHASLPPGEPWGFVRIQSTACEQKRWDFLIQDLDVDFLQHLAAGTECVVWDFSQRKRATRAVYQGLAWIAYAATRRWFGVGLDPVVRSHRCGDYFGRCFRFLDPRTLRKLDYHRRFLLTDSVRIVGMPGTTGRDGDDAYHAELMRSAFGGSPDCEAGISA